MNLELPKELFHVHQYIDEKNAFTWLERKNWKLKTGFHYAVRFSEDVEQLRADIVNVVMESLNTGGSGAGLTTQSLRTIYQDLDTGRTIKLIDMAYAMSSILADKSYEKGINPIRVLGLGYGCSIWGNRFVCADGSILSIKHFMIKRVLDVKALYKALGLH